MKIYMERFLDLNLDKTYLEEDGIWVTPWADKVEQETQEGSERKLAVFDDGFMTEERYTEDEDSTADSMNEDDGRWGEVSSSDHLD